MIKKKRQTNLGPIQVKLWEVPFSLKQKKKKERKIRQVVKLVLNHDPIQRFRNKWKSVQDIYLGLLSHFCTSVSFPLQYKTDAFFLNISL